MDNSEVEMLEYLVSETDARHFAHLKEVLLANEPPTVAFVGSGLSLSNGYASWDELVAGLAKSVGLEMPQTHRPRDRGRELLAVCDKVYTCYQSQAENPVGCFRVALRNCLARHVRAKYHTSHADLLKIGLSCIITTNFDPSLSVV